MKHLARLVQVATPTTTVKFRKHAYGKNGVQNFLRDVLAMANAAVEGSRYIVTGAEFDARGRKRLYAFYVASQLPRLPRDDRFIDRTPAEQADYPTVTARDDAISISVKLGDIPPGEPIEVFRTPLRLCVGSDLKGRRIGIQYSLFAQNLRSAATGKLRLLF